MNYSTFHGANSVNTFNMLLDDYVADQLNEFDKEITISARQYEYAKEQYILGKNTKIY